MKITLIFGSLFFLAIILLVVSGALRPTTPLIDTDTAQTDFNEITYPGNTVTIPPPPSDGIKLTLTSGETVIANDIRTIEGMQKVGDNLYSLTGLPGDPTAPAGFFFNAENESIAISITAQPIPENHRAVSLAFKNMMGLNEVELCQLNVFVGVPSDLDPIWSGQNLELSFCPGAAAL